MTPSPQPSTPRQARAAADLPPEGPGPVRTCVGCRRRAPKAGLVRIVWAQGRARALVDAHQHLPGRGAYVHPVSACIDRALKPGKLARALRARMDSSHTTALRQPLTALFEPPGVIDTGLGQAGGGEDRPPSGTPASNASNSHSPKRLIHHPDSMSSTTTEILSENSSQTATNRVANGLTRRPFMDDTRRARGK
ncbi:YlxR family protein [Haliangium sp.]|uniref:YlxR family protein n=1 Tax=Haliangium sp. TaxID=2663208 RepID=UPI003D0E81CC